MKTKVNNILLHTEKNARSYMEKVSAFNNDEDFILASFPKSGNTWLRFLFANYINEMSGKIYDEIDFHNVSHACPPLRAPKEHMSGSRLKFKSLKTHFPSVGKFYNFDAVVLYREPVKTLRSYYDYMIYEKGKRFKDEESFISHWKYGVDSWCYFHNSWLQRECQKKTLFVNYKDLLDNPVSAMELLFFELKKPVFQNSLSTAIEKSSKENMKRVLEKQGDPYAQNENYNFVGDKKDRKNLSDNVCKIIYEKSSHVYNALEDKKLIVYR
ncbi:sulfotransferase domain-containing protein [Halomonas sp. M4R1S46]|uniref:sulfotransferase domain-containing protein n=1 Tax=Halomonas sp. M4R1S46 TaxID=2982692 RepID=UPI0021E46C9E|nr:sulfotransferase domain-containing protein [Halomonas sp. M4R1S46]UYG06057.1 sulfotransferase domain-containing protein [Halomonas sp. M4R1S46]